MGGDELGWLAEFEVDAANVYQNLSAGAERMANSARPTGAPGMAEAPARGWAHHGIHTWWTAAGTRIRHTRLRTLRQLRQWLDAAGLTDRRALVMRFVVALRRVAVWIPLGLILAIAVAYAARWVTSRLRQAIPEPKLLRVVTPATTTMWVESVPIWSAGGECSGGTMQVMPKLVAHLRSVSTFRNRDYNLLLSLRNRAVVWCRENSLSDETMAEVMPGSVAQAFQMHDAEVCAVASLTSWAAHRAIELSRQLSTGQPLKLYPNKLWAWWRGHLGTTGLLSNWRAEAHSLPVVLNTA